MQLTYVSLSKPLRQVNLSRIIELVLKKILQETLFPEVDRCYCKIHTCILTHTLPVSRAYQEALTQRLKVI